MSVTLLVAVTKLPEESNLSKAFIWARGLRVQTIMTAGEVLGRSASAHRKQK